MTAAEKKAAEKKIVTQIDSLLAALNTTDS
jgi:hypothetical protein